MPPWWGKSSSKEVKKKASRESFIDTIQRKLKISSEEKCSSRSGDSRRQCSDTVSEKGSLSHAQLLSPSLSTQVSRCQSFAERPHPQPLPRPEVHLANSIIIASTKPGFDKGSKPSLLLPHPGSGNIQNRPDPADGDLATASVSSDGYLDSDDPSESRLLSPQASDYEYGNRTAMNSPSRVKLKEHCTAPNRDTSREMLKLDNILLNNQTHPTSPKQGHLITHVPNLHIPYYGAVRSAPDSSMSSPSRSPMRVFGHEPVMNSSVWAGKPYPDVALLGSGQCSSPGSGHNSGGGDMTGQLFWQHNRCSPGCSPIPSSRMTSPGPSSRIHSGAVTPLHPRAGLTAMETPANRSDEKKLQSHRLPLPPITISNSCPFSPSYSMPPPPPLPRSPGKAETPTSPGSRWKKGRLLGRGTFGHVYLGFNSESGEMCAMKEVTLFSDDAKSKESAQQLGQEITLLSRLRHPNIVQYYGSETVVDKLYIYLEYVSGGSIYKILQDYGPLGEIAIRSYTQQILSGLAYLHGKTTIHRDIKGANILVDPSGRVKLADFGMAKHITGQSCPLSLKGSPYWMAPEVIKNSNGFNLAVDIWSLGCTVLEMATGKPPWSQYEGVAAMFKIGNSKELPSIPDHLSDEGKDFVRLCLQRNPLHRPTAAQLLDHQFVKNAATLDRPILNSEPSEPPPTVSIPVRSPGTGHNKNVSCLDPEGMAIHNPRRLKTGSGFSDARALVPRNISCPVSPIGSPLLHSRSPQHMSARMSPSPISSPRTPSGSTTPLTGGSGAIPVHNLKQPTYLHESIGTISRSQNNLHPNVSSSYLDPRPDLFCGLHQGSHAFHELVSAENGFLGNQFGRTVQGRLHDGQLVLADRVSQQLLRDDLKLNPFLDLNQGSPTLGRTIGI
ncbi:mitogen-activated protein kinase kinase kinase YODA-like [Actinidia eriantha]|uniref:mitogen-activated protein kinase kinase kinase YODA-like n=1 Tax=Actinidia eriantha TaxID=165200 RepID=UPI0025888EFD|nr:mitogen-activated protein kinase kinase kinase YODA-like [Actinidia eriantha]XP_057463339.1 mitogen-activated protein kinase kinase kinase YODA-like [Actinidia eriantha]XP_057463340.1 mitogen-activated protein kinase kinase kinase YODA-like [Actinidia eriantha]XP_057463341.1 mitogen-activated protein kinase kinase kinase YODA-like [Actinidia eriantha]